MRPLPGRLSAENITLKLLTAEAYRVYDYQISGGPKWVESERYDVEAKAAGDPAANRTQLRVMLQNLLADRFGLTVRHESKEMSMFLLEVGKRGPKLRKAVHPDDPLMFRVFQRRQIVAENAPLDHLTDVMTWLLGRPVMDRTGLEAGFDYKPEWSPDELQLQSQEASPQTNGKAPSLGAALQQQLGLRLASAREPVELLTVEKAEKPTDN
jgi:uncharacterized protein (TIGR03435 family)